MPERLQSQRAQYGPWIATSKVCLKSDFQLPIGLSWSIKKPGSVDWSRKVIDFSDSLMFMVMDTILPIHVIVTLCINVSIHSASHVGAPRWLWCFLHGTARKTWSEGAALAYHFSHSAWIALGNPCFLSTKFWVGTLVSPIKTPLDGCLKPAETGIPACGWSMMLPGRMRSSSNPGSTDPGRVRRPNTKAFTAELSWWDRCSSALCLFFKNRGLRRSTLRSGTATWAPAGRLWGSSAEPLRLVSSLRG